MALCDTKEGHTVDARVQRRNAYTLLSTSRLTLERAQCAVPYRWPVYAEAGVAQIGGIRGERVGYIEEEMMVDHQCTSAPQAVAWICRESDRAINRT